MRLDDLALAATRPTFGDAIVGFVRIIAAVWGFTGLKTAGPRPSGRMAKMLVSSLRDSLLRGRFNHARSYASRASFAWACITGLAGAGPPVLVVDAMATLEDF